LKRNQKIAFIIILLFLIAAFFTYQYVFSIYEVFPEVEPKVLYADHKSESKIKLIPVNSLGWKIPFRNAAAEFEISEGKELVEIVSVSGKEGIIVLRANDKPGKVSILIKSKYSLLLLIVEMEVCKNLT
jgi:hypothetical protein